MHSVLQQGKNKIYRHSDSLGEKRSHRQMLEANSDQSECYVTGGDNEDDDDFNTTNHVESPLLILFNAEKRYYGCFYNPSICELQILDPISQSKEDSRVIDTLIRQFEPDTLICNNKVRLHVGAQSTNEQVNIKVKSSREFSSGEGKRFLENFSEELSQKLEKQEFLQLKTFVDRLKLSDAYHYYCCILSAFSLEIEATTMGQNRTSIADTINKMSFVAIEGFMTLELETIVSLGIKKMDESNNKKTVFDLFGKACSKIGNDMLSNFLMRPLYNITHINERLDTVAAILYELESGRKGSLVKKMMESIRGIADITSVSHQLRIGNCRPAVWKKLRNYVTNVINLKEQISSSSKLTGCKLFKDFNESFEAEEIHVIRQKLEKILDFDTDLDNPDIRNTIDGQLDAYRNTYDEMEQILNELSLDLSKAAGVDIVTAYIPQFGYLIAIDKGNAEESSNEKQLGLELVFQTSTTNYYKNETMLEMDSKYGDLYSLIKDKEIEIFYELKNEIIPHLSKLVTIYSYVGQIDVLICFATVSLKNRFSKPQILDDRRGEKAHPVIKLAGSFHPLIEKHDFISNDIIFDEARMIVITGPNYSGKSTVLTQVGLTVYLAQIGCFIPASSGKLSIFKNILTRVNTMDSINTTQSTFMKDCEQMSRCIHRSNNKSLVLIDEFGKGTDVNDGPGLLGGVINHFMNRGDECPIVIVSTHMSEIFHQDMMGMDERIQFHHMKVFVEDNKAFKMTFLYELVAGITYSSGGLYCAKQCGIDLAVVEKAQYILDMLQEGKDIVQEFSQLDGEEMCIIRDNEERMKRFLELDFQEWEEKDVGRLREEVMRILH